MAKSFINKKPKKIGERLMRSGARAAAAVGGLYAAEWAKNNDKVKVNPKYLGPIMMGLGLAGEVYLADDTMRSVAEGMTVSGSILMARDFVFKENAAKIGLAGQVSDTAPIPADVVDLNFDAALREAEALQDRPAVEAGEPEARTMEFRPGRDTAMAGIGAMAMEDMPDIF